jgi:hypothetical protein
MQRKPIKTGSVEFFSENFGLITCYKCLNSRVFQKLQLKRQEFFSVASFFKEILLRYL